MLRTIRITLAILALIAITLIFVDFTGFAVHHWGWIAKFQFIPALLSLNILALAVILLVTVLMGRLYCSVLCPLGVLQDVVTRLRLWCSKKTKRKIGMFHFRKAHNVLRYMVLSCFALLIALGFINLSAAAFASIIEPYSAFGRIASGLFAPVVDWANNIPATWDAEREGYTFYEVYRLTSPMVSIVGLITLIVVGALALTNGRLYCNSICPVGTTLGLISRYSVLSPIIDTNKCNGCRSCERHCKSSCIDAGNHKIDLSRCVVCMDCISHCKQDAISFGLRTASATAEAPKTSVSNVDNSRRKMMTLVGLAGGAAVAKAAGLADGGVTPLLARKAPVRTERITPPGAVGHRHLAEHCVACQLCVQNCPNGVLRPSTDLETFMQPVMDYANGYCTPECTKCAEVCPAGVFNVIDEATKSSTKIGTAHVDLDICLSASQDVTCGNCARSCPADAITMVPVNEDDAEGPLMPVVDENICIGCGACEFHCPVGRVEATPADHPAIHVDGISMHREI